MLARPAFHDANGRPLIDKKKFPDGLGHLVAQGHARNLTVSWYGNACACSSENSYTKSTQPTINQAIAGTVAATVAYVSCGIMAYSLSLSLLSLLSLSLKQCALCSGPVPVSVSVPVPVLVSAVPAVPVFETVSTMQCARRSVSLI